MTQVLHDHDHETFAESPHFIYICAGASEVCAGERKTFYASPCPAQPTPLSLFEKNDGSVGGDGDGDYDGGNGEGDENGDDTDDADDADYADYADDDADADGDDGDDGDDGVDGDDGDDDDDEPKEVE